MGVKVSELLVDLAKRAGIEIDLRDEKFKELAVTSVELSPEIANGIKTGLLSVDAAVENDTVRGRILAAGMGALDKDVLKRAEELGLTDLIEDLKTEKSTRTKVNKLIEAALDAEMKKAGAGNKGEKAEYEKQISDLNAQLKKIRDDFEAEKTSLVNQHNDVLISKELDFALSGYEYADTSFGKEFVVKYAKDSVLENLNKNTGKFILENGQLKLVNAKTGGELFDSQNNKLDVKGILDTSVAKLLKKADPTPPAKKEIELPAGGETQHNPTGQTLVSMAQDMLKGT